MAVSPTLARLRSVAWLGWQIEGNWADALVFVTYWVARPLATALVLMGMYWAASGGRMGREAFVVFYLGNAFHEYVARMVIGMGWAVVEEREQFETLKYVAVVPMGLLTYLSGRAVVKFAQSTLSVTVLLLLGWFAFGLRWDLSATRWVPFLATYAIGLVAVIYLSFLVAGFGFLLPQAAMNINDGLAVSLYLLCGVIYPIDLLPRVLQNLTMALPFTWWYEGLRRFLLGHGASARLSHWSDGALLGMLALVTAAFVVTAHFGYRALERAARRQGRLDQTTLF